MADRSNRAEYRQPSNLTEGETQRQALVSEIARISTQLSDKNRLKPDGARLSNEEYHAWRKKALIALRAREASLRRLNTWLAQERRRLTPDTDPYNLIDEAYRLFHRLKEEDVDFSQDEWAVVDRLRLYLERAEAGSTP